MNESRVNLGDILAGEGSALAVVDLSSGAAQSYTFDAFDAVIRNIAESMDVAENQRIGLLGVNSAAFLATFFAVMRRGGVAVPMSTKFPADLFEYIQGDAELVAAYADDALAELLPSGLERRPLPQLDDSDGQAGDVVIPAPGRAALVLYTSGSTGRPKGVLLSHDSQWAMVDRMKNVLDGAVGIVAAPLYHMNGLLFSWSLLAGGGTVVLMSRFDARGYLQAIHDHRVSVLTGVPTMLSLMLKEQDLLDTLDLTSVAAISVGSAPLSETLISEVREVFPNAHITNGYGTTEAGAGMFGAHPDGIPVPALSLGHVQPHVDVRLVGGASDDEGVMEVRTPAAMSGYLNLPEKTADKMDGEGWINTGDIMRRDEQGFFYFVGRDDDMFNCGGENIYPGEVERILETDARVAECCVVPVADDIKGQKPVAFVVPAIGQVVTEQEVKDVALAAAPAFMHPRRVYFLDTMPLAGTNKIDRKALTLLAAERATPDGD